MEKWIAIGLLILLGACKENTTHKITRPEDYNDFLKTEVNPTYREAYYQRLFWSKRLNKDTTGLGDIGPLAAAYESLFKATGEVNYLKDAETLYQKGRNIAAPQFKDAFDRGLAQNYISQHRFKEALSILEESMQGVSQKRAAQLMLFDVAMELGNYEQAYELLTKTKDLSDFHYLIRLSKWSDYKGDLDSAIKYMEQAMERVEAADNKPMRIWVYSNIADYYGHAGNIEKSYQYYLKTLALQPDNAYAKKGIVWVLYAAEKNTTEAHRVLDSIMKSHTSPEYHLLKSELYAYEGNTNQSETQDQLFLEAIEKAEYGTMYNTYLIEHYAENQPGKALQIAEKELYNRATPETYHLWAWALLHNNQKAEALQVIEDHVAGKTHEPLAYYHMAVIYKANGKDDEIPSLKAELLDASYELGPLLTREIEKL